MTSLRMDEAAWARYQHCLAKKQAREHIVTVQHTKAQNNIGSGRLACTPYYVEYF